MGAEKNVGWEEKSVGWEEGLVGGGFGGEEKVVGGSSTKSSLYSVQRPFIDLKFHSFFPN